METYDPVVTFSFPKSRVSIEGEKFFLDTKIYGKIALENLQWGEQECSTTCNLSYLCQECRSLEKPQDRCSVCGSESLERIKKEGGPTSAQKFVGAILRGAAFWQEGVLMMDRIVSKEANDGTGNLMVQALERSWQTEEDKNKFSYESRFLRQLGVKKTSLQGITSQKVTSEEFMQLLHKEKVVVADFYADWCYPCQVFGSVLEEISSELEGKAKLIRVNFETSTDLVSRYQITMLPTLVLFVNGQEKGRFVGLSDAKTTLEFILSKSSAL